MKQKIYLLAIIITTLCLGLYLPRLYTYAQDKAEQRKTNQQILDLELELEDVKSEWKTLDSDKIDYIWQIETLSWYVAEIQSEQDNLHNRAEQIRKEIDILKWNASLNDELINCYQWTWDLYNDCLDAIIYTGLQQRRQPQ